MFTGSFADGVGFQFCSFVGRIPPEKNCIEGILAKPQNKTELQTYLYDLKGSVIYALGRISANPGVKAGDVLIKLSKLQSRIDEMSMALASASYCSHEQCHKADLEAFALDFSTLLFEDEHAQATLFKLPHRPHLDKAIDEHPVISMLDLHIAGVAVAIGLGVTLGGHVHLAHAGAHAFYFVVAAASADNKEGKAAFLNLADNEINKEEAAAEKEAEAQAKAEGKAFTEKDRSSIKEAFDDLKKRMHDFSQTMRNRTDLTQGRVKAAYAQFVEAPIKQLSEEYPTYHAQISKYLGDKAQICGDVMQKAIDGLRGCVGKFNAEQTAQDTPPDFVKIMTAYQDINGTCKTCNAVLNEEVTKLCEEEKQAKAARMACACALTGEAELSKDSCNKIEDIAKAENIPEVAKDLNGSIRKFRAEYLKGFVNTVQEKWELLFPPKEKSASAK